MQTLVRGFLDDNKCFCNIAYVKCNRREIKRKRNYFKIKIFTKPKSMYCVTISNVIWWRHNVTQQKLRHNVVVWRNKESDHTLFTAGSWLFVVLGRVRMKRERFDAGGAFGIPSCDPKETYGAPAAMNGLWENNGFRIEKSWAPVTSNIAKFSYTLRSCAIYFRVCIWINSNGPIILRNPMIFVS